MSGYRSGYVALIGRPNVGKSTLLNHILEQKLSITSRRPQTTRMQLLGIHSTPQSQAVYIDTPGFQKKTGNAMSRYMNREVSNALAQVDIIVHVCTARWTQHDAAVYKLAAESNKPVILAVNKIDTFKNKQALLPQLDELAGQGTFADIVPISARRRQNIDQLEQAIHSMLPEGDPLYPDDQVTDKSERFFAAEFIREKLTRRLGAELPYNISVTIDEFRIEKKLARVTATIWVATSGQKAIVIGRDGAVLKSVGEKARKEMENLFGQKVYLRTWVKIKKKWTDDVNALRQLGYEH